MFKFAIQYSFLLTIICSLFSQLPDLLGSTLTTVLKMTWLVPFALCLLLNPHKLIARSVLPSVAFVLAFAFYCFMLDSLTEPDYLGVDLTNMTISLFVCIVSYLVWRNCGDDKFFNKICVITLLAAFVVAIVIYRDFLLNSSIADLKYAYDAKNSMGQILLNTVIICFLGFLPHGKVKRGAYIALILFLLLEIFLLKSRATLVGLGFVIAYMAFGIRNKFYKRAIWFVLIGGAVYLVANSEMRSILVDNILFANRDVSDLDDLSSGRIHLIEMRLSQMDGHLFFGIGNFYLDCFPIAILGQYGIFGAAIVFAYIAWLAKTANKTIGTKTKYGLIAFLLFWTLMLNALFEAQPPFGPGMKCFPLWMMLGFSLSQIDKKMVIRNI